MAAATMSKAALLEENNTLLLMTTPETPLCIPKAYEYLRLRQMEELKKLQKRLVDDEEQERQGAPDCCQSKGSSEEAGFEKRCFRDRVTAT
jgi:hypothetical protein